MSRRAIRKAFPETNIGLNIEASKDDESGSETAQSNAVNQFLLLNGSDESDTGSTRSPSPVPVRALSPAKKIKKKTNLKSKKVPTKNLERISSDQLGELHTSLHDLTISTAPAIDGLLRCEARYFDSDRELRNLFGSSVLRQDEPDSSTARFRRPVRSQRTRLRKTALVKPKDEWSHIPLSQIGLSMRFDPDTKIFQYEMSVEYLNMQEQFEAASMTFDPQSIATLLQFQPWHCDTLIQMGEIYRVHGEFASSADLIARALYAFECNFHPKFDFLSGTPTCYLDPQSPGTSSFIRALRRHMQFNGRKGCVRTAFEISKLFMNVSRSPTPALCSSFTMEALMHMVYYALRSNAFSFVLDFASHFDLSLSQNVDNTDQLPLSSTLFMLPIWCFSTALAKYKTEKDGALFNDVVLVTSAVNRDDVTSSLLVQQALLLYPEALEPLLLQSSPNELSKPSWKLIFSHSLFRDARLRLQDTPSIKRLINVFVTRCHSLWKESDILDWLAINAENLVQKIDEGICVTEEYDQNRARFLQTAACDEACKLDVSEFSDSISTIPLAEQRRMDAQQNPGPSAENPFTGQNPLMAFLSSLLPWVNVPDEQQQ